MKQKLLTLLLVTLCGSAFALKIVSVPFGGYDTNRYQLAPWWSTNSPYWTNNPRYASNGIWGSTSDTLSVSNWQCWQAVDYNFSTIQSNGFFSSPKCVLFATNSFTCPYLGTNVLCTVSNFAGFTFTLTAGQPTIQFSTDGTNWTLSQAATTNQVRIRVTSRMVPSFGGVPADPTISAVTVWGLAQPDLFGHTNALYGQSVRVGDPVTLDDAVSWGFVSNMFAATPWMSAQSEVQLNGYGLHMNSVLDQQSDTNSIRWRFLGTDLFSAQAAPVALGTISTITIENTTNIAINVATNGQVAPLLQFTPSLNPTTWAWVTNQTTSYPYQTNGLWTVKTPMPTNAIGFYRVAYAQAGQSRLSVAGLLALTPRKVTNSTDTTWGSGAGLVCVDSNYVYVSVGTNLWKRAALSSW
jgi:hypothetical protein